MLTTIEERLEYDELVYILLLLLYGCRRNKPVKNKCVCKMLIVIPLAVEHLQFLVPDLPGRMRGKLFPVSEGVFLRRDAGSSETACRCLSPPRTFVRAFARAFARAFVPTLEQTVVPRRPISRTTLWWGGVIRAVRVFRSLRLLPFGHGGHGSTKRLRPQFFVILVQGQRG